VYDISMKAKASKQRLSAQVKAFLLSPQAGGEEGWNEEKLARRFKVSRTPIRDVLYELESQGVIVRRHKRGIALRQPSIKEIAEVYEVRAALEKLAIGRAVTYVTPEDIAVLRKIVRQIHLAIRRNDIARTDELDATFHATIIEISGNQYLRSMIDQFNLLIRAFQLASWFHQPSVPIGDPEHESIVDALERRDRRTCIKLMGRHINGARKVFLRQVVSSPVSNPNPETAEV